jgi:hypothetical protein
VTLVVVIVVLMAAYAVCCVIAAAVVNALHRLLQAVWGPVADWLHYRRGWRRFLAEYGQELGGPGEPGGGRLHSGAGGPAW